MNDKSHACDCPADMPTQLCVRYCIGECDGPSDTTINLTPSELESELSVGVPSALAHAETVGERLKRVYPEHYTRIITEMNRQNGSEHTARQLSSPYAEWTSSDCVLHGAFLWSNSQEGRSFWAKLAERERS